LYRHVAFIENETGKHGVDLEKINISINKQEQINNVRNKLIEHAVERKCVDPNFPDATDFRTFAAVYAKYYIFDFIDALLDKLLYFTPVRQKNRAMVLPKKPSTGGSCKLFELPQITKHHKFVCNEVISYIITRNIPLNSYAEDNNVYLRIYGDTLFPVSDPSLPFVTFPPLPPPEEDPPLDPLGKKLGKGPGEDPGEKIKEERGEVQKLTALITDIPALNIPEERDPNAVLRFFRSWPVIQKMVFLEHCIATGKISLLHNISQVYLSEPGNNKYYHFLMYKNLTTSYTSSNPTPKNAKGKTRYFDGNKWSYLVNNEEYILRLYHDLIEKEIEDMYNQYDGYIGIISTIDGKMRLRLRQNEDRDKSQRDLRYIMRGKNLLSINKNTLQEVCASLNINNAQRVQGNGERTLKYINSLSIAQLADYIDTQLVSMGRYVII
jgi:hypothetical protein